MPYWVIPELNIELVFLQEKDKKLVTSKIAEHLNAIWDNTLGSQYPALPLMALESQLVGFAGFGVYVGQLGVKIGQRISNGSSVFTSELMAILWALRWIKETRPREIIICSDSAAALEALRGGRSKARPDIIIDILTVLFKIGVRSNITFCWVPGHTGVGGNEQVDQIAKQSLRREVDVHILGESGAERNN